ncbi:hypothetical protein N0V93_009602 [Gnomoniopsis smithogilvyi]|uniref:2-dehydropantoate 2-reductase n=1 Tax=Gnomoniopsis smithogilvyi TaxID=1191159 RepID=A0A9W8YJX4_9PEZI|nr:hypothetical protein N0V93_009602 [Gnomoniopsis smithogilvyi]
MAPKSPRLKILSVGGNAVSAFLSWRLQATNACDVTLVWKSGFEHVAQYGISFKSAVFGNERFKPRRVVRSPEEAVNTKEGAFDYVVLCVKALPDVYDLASVIDSVVVPNHTCILINTTNTIGIEAAIEERYPTNVVLSLVAGADLTQLGQSEFEQKGSTELWIGPAKRNADIPATIQDDMASALAMTLSSGQIDAKVSPNIRQHQYERVIGPIAFFPTSVIFEATSYSELLAMPAVRPLVSGVIDELLELATANGCKFDADFKQKTMDEMTRQPLTESIMWQDFQARRPMEVETYLGSPVKLAQEANIKVPRIETLYAMLHHLNVVNRNRPKIDTAAAAQGPPPPSGSPTSMIMASPQPRMSAAPGPRGKVSNGMSMANGNGMPPPRRPRGSSQLGPPAGMRRPSSNAGAPNGYGRPSMNGGANGYPRQQLSRRGSVDEDLAEEFGHLANLQEHMEDGGEIDLREREYQLRQRELALRDQEMRMRGPPRGPMGPMGPPGPRRVPPPRAPGGGMYDDDDDDEDYFDPNSAPPMPMIDPDNFDMMSVTSRKNRHQQKPSASQFRNNPQMGDVAPSRGSRFRPSFGGRNRSSQLGPPGQPFTANILDDPLMNMTDNRYGHVDRSAMQAESRANSMTSNAGWQNGPGGPSPMFQRRASQSPGYAPSMRGGSGRPSPPNGYGPGMNGRPSPPNGVRQPVPQYPPGHGNAVAPQQVEQHAGRGQW